MRVDPDALAEALEDWDDRGFWLSSVFWHRIVAAARAVLDAPTAEWCETHDAEGQTPEKAGSGYVPGLCFGAIGGEYSDKPCKVGRVRLVAELLDEEPTREEVPESSKQPDDPGPLR